MAELQPEAEGEWMSDDEVLDMYRDELPWGWEPVISTTHDGVYFMNMLGHCQWDVPTEEAWDEEDIPAEIAETRWLKTLRCVRVRECADLKSRIVGSLPAGEMVYVLEMAQVGKRQRRACIRCHMGWFSLSVVDQQKTIALEERLKQLSLAHVLARATVEGVDTATIDACKLGRLPRSELVHKILKLAASHQRVSNPNTVWARILQVAPCSNLVLLQSTEPVVSKEAMSAASTLPPPQLADHCNAPFVPVPPARPRLPDDPNRQRHNYRPRSIMAKNEGLSAGVYPHHVPECKSHGGTG